MTHGILKARTTSQHGIVSIEILSGRERLGGLAPILRHNLGGAVIDDHVVVTLVGHGLDRRDYVLGLIVGRDNNKNFQRQSIPSRFTKHIVAGSRGAHVLEKLFHTTLPQPLLKGIPLRV